jgi:hypothetical protein
VPICKPGAHVKAESFNRCPGCKPSADPLNLSKAPHGEGTLSLLRVEALENRLRYRLGRLGQVDRAEEAMPHTSCIGERIRCHGTGCNEWCLVRLASY